MIYHAVLLTWISVKYRTEQISLHASSLKLSLKKYLGLDVKYIKTFRKSHTQSRVTVINRPPCKLP